MSDAFDRSASRVRRAATGRCREHRLLTNHENLLFANWRVDSGGDAPAVTDAFDLDLFAASWRRGHVLRPMGLRAERRCLAAAFTELNVRTYVRVADGPGVTLDWTLGAVRRRGGAGRTNLPSSRGHEVELVRLPGHFPERCRSRGPEN